MIDQLLTVYDLTYAARPWTQNSERNLHHHEKARRVAEWRLAFEMLARAAKVPACTQVAITAQTFLRKRVSRDVGAEMPAVKAAIDGCVDAGVVPDDTPAHLVRLTFLSPVLGAERDELVLTIERLA